MFSVRPATPWTKAAEAADNQIDRHAGGGSFAKQFDHLRVFELVHLGDDARRSPVALMGDLALDQFGESQPHCGRSYQQRGAFRRLGMAG